MRALLFALCFNGATPLQCEVLNSPVAGTSSIPDVPDQECCDTIIAVTMAMVARSPDLPLPWSAAASAVGVLQCTISDNVAALVPEAVCGDEPANVADDRSMALLAAHLCSRWDSGCTTADAVSTGLAESLLAMSFVPEAMYASLGCVADVPAPAASAPVECPVLDSAVAGTSSIPSVSDQMCCDAITAVTMGMVARSSDLPMPWSAAAPAIGVLACTISDDVAAVVPGAVCGDEPANVADDASMALLAAYLCSRWDSGCTTADAVSTGLAESLLGPSFVPETMYASLGCVAEVPAPAASAPVECPVLDSAVAGTSSIPSVSDQTCCDAIIAVAMAMVARSSDLPMPWSAAAPAIGVLACTISGDVAAVVPGVVCGDEPSNVADDASVALLAAYVCSRWDSGCTTADAISTGLAESLLGPSFVPETMYASLGCSSATLASATTAQPSTTLTPEALSPPEIVPSLDSPIPSYSSTLLDEHAGAPDWWELVRLLENSSEANRGYGFQTSTASWVAFFLAFDKIAT